MKKEEWRRRAREYYATHKNDPEYKRKKKAYYKKRHEKNRSSVSSSARERYLARRTSTVDPKEREIYFFNQDLVQKLLEYKKEHNLNTTELSKEIKINITTTSEIIRGKRKTLRYKTIDNICTKLAIPMKKILGKKKRLDDLFFYKKSMENLKKRLDESRKKTIENKKGRPKKESVVEIVEHNAWQNEKERASDDIINTPEEELQEYALEVEQFISDYIDENWN